MAQVQACIGIDWGTHSSKWTWTGLETDSIKPIRGRFKILRSDVRLNETNNSIFLSVDPPPSGSIYAPNLKGALIKDPDGSFWVGARKRVKLTRGELVSFSLWYLLGEAYQNCCESLQNEPGEVDVRFSLPNWVDIDAGAVARACYEQAAHVTCHIFAGNRGGGSRTAYSVRESWQEKTREALTQLKISDESEINRDPQGFRMMLQKPINIGQGVKFCFVAESSAAGLAGLRVEEMETDIEETKVVRKILVVDVGAGSTDIGYVIRAIPPKNSKANESLCQLPPANTCQIAGADLSNRIVEIYRSRGEEMGFTEAETRKIVGDDHEWLSHPAVVDWKHTIAAHVKRYVTDIPDNYWLPLKNPGLQVLVTGGSGAVTGLRDEILAAAKEGLANRGYPLNVVQETTLMDLRLEGSDAKDANRLAVAIGAASEDLPRLGYHPKLDPPIYA
jgi:hypothetical protein